MENQALPVQLRFACDAASDVSWQVLAATFTERLGAPYALQLRLATGNPNAAPGRLLGTPCRVSFTRGSAVRQVAGIVAEVRQGSTQSDLITSDAVVVPALEALRHRPRCRIFQDQTVPRILERVFREGLASYGRTVELRLEGADFEVLSRTQLHESDLDFCQRLMQEAGILWWFEHEGGAERLVLADRSEGHGRIESSDDPLLLFSDYEAEADRHEYVNELMLRSQAFPAETMIAHDWARAPDSVEIDTGADPVEIAGDGARLAEGRSTVLGMTVARSFELFGHPQPNLDGNYLVLSVTHWLEDGGARYRNHFRCVPAGTPIQPRALGPRPRISSVQAATVVGAAGEEVHLDDQGRVRVRLHWDHESEDEEDKTCWVPVARLASASFPPRVGSEVLVSFIDGDPDRPVVTAAIGGAQAAPDVLDLSAPTRVLLSCGDSSIRIEPGRITVTAGDGASLTLDSGARLASSQDSEVTLGSAAELRGAAEAKVTAPRAAVEGRASAELTGGAGSVKADAGGVTVTGPKGSVKADPRGVNVTGDKVNLS